MARIQESIEIKCQVDKVFAYTTDAKNWPKWQSFIPEAEQTSQGPMNVGTTLKGVSRMMSRSMRWTAIAYPTVTDRSTFRSFLYKLVRLCYLAIG
jgi:hypothetical protein